MEEKPPVEEEEPKEEIEVTSEDVGMADVLNLSKELPEEETPEEAAQPVGEETDTDEKEPDVKPAEPLEQPPEEVEPPVFFYVVDIESPEHGSVEMKKKVEGEKEIVLLKAIPDEGYKFRVWKVQRNAYSTDAEIEVPVEGNLIIEAYFIEA